MRAAPYLYLILGIVIGYGFAQVNMPNATPALPSETSQINTANATQEAAPVPQKPYKKLLKEANFKLIAAGLDPVLAIPDAGATETAPTPDLYSYADTLDQAREAIAKFQYDKAMSLYHQLLNESQSAEERDAAIAGLVHTYVFDLLVSLFEIR